MLTDVSLKVEIAINNKKFERANKRTNTLSKPYSK